MKSYECRSCGALILTDDFPSPLSSPWCPVCRGRTTLVTGEEDESKFDPFACPSCGVSFSLEKGRSPYKCVKCNYTFPITPYRKQEEKL